MRALQNRPSLTRLILLVGVLGAGLGVWRNMLSKPEAHVHQVEAVMPDMTGLPESLGPLPMQFKGKKWREMREVIVATFGPPQRNVGNGAIIEQWDIGGGVLTLHNLVGPTFEFEGGKERKVHYLMPTANRLADSVIADYEMCSRSSLNPLSGGAWAGNLKLNPRGTYEFVAQMPDEDLNQRALRKDFLRLHPTGTFQVKYLRGLKADSLLEKCPDGPIAEITLIAEYGEKRQKYSIVNDQNYRCLDVQVKPSPLWTMERGW